MPGAATDEKSAGRVRCSSGDHGGNSYEVRWDGAMAVFVHRAARNKLLAMERIAPSSVEWERFWKWMDEHGCWDWPEVCVNKMEVVDGTYWNLMIETGDRRMVSGGSNAYPGSQTAEPGEEFRAFVKQIERLLGGVEFR
jgi:hypothetical protein